MSHWNYRIVKDNHKDEEMYGLYEIYYDDDDTPNAMTVDAVFGPYDSIDELQAVLERMLEVVKEKKMFEPPESWK